MNIRNKLMISILSATASLTALPANAGPNHPVCALARDVSTTLGRASGPSINAYCFVERKVVAIDGEVNVSNVLGRSALLFDHAKKATTTVASRELKGSAVELVLGRSSDIPAVVRQSEQSIASGSQH